MDLLLLQFHITIHFLSMTLTSLYFQWTTSLHQSQLVKASSHYSCTKWAMQYYNGWRLGVALFVVLFLALEIVSWDQHTKLLDRNFHWFYFPLLVQCKHPIQLPVQIWARCFSAACLKHAVRDESAQICSPSCLHVNYCICKLCLGKSDQYLVPELNLWPNRYQVYTGQKQKNQ